MRQYKLYLASILSGILLALAWPTDGFTTLIFIALVPLLWAEDIVFTENFKAFKCGTKIKTKYFIYLYAFVAFLTWNTITTYWIYNSTPAAVLAFVVNSALLALTFYLAHLCGLWISKFRNYNSRFLRYTIMIIFWVAFEFHHHNWDISWTWLTLGNVFATQPKWIQWYEVTGILGGSIWVLLSNIMILQWLKLKVTKSENQKKQSLKFSLICCTIILLPLIASFMRFSTYKADGKAIEVVVVQPNIDPYQEQYNIDPVKATERMLILSEYKLSDSTKFIITPESMIQEYIWEDRLHLSPSINIIQDFLKNYPNCELLAGISTYTNCENNDSITKGIRKEIVHGKTLKYRAHNTILAINKDGINGVRHKSKLTPAVEVMPLVDKLAFLENLAINLGGTVGSLGIDKEAKVFNHDGIKYADIICYESLFGDYVTEFTRKGAEIFFISTNDGWWGNTPGHKQHCAYAALRAIENRRDIARSANTGISCFINQKGEFVQYSGYWETAVLEQNMISNSRITIYAKYGDIIGRVSRLMFILFLSLGIVARIRGRNSNF